MEIYVSIDGVLRNLIQKFDYHYRDYYLEREEDGTAILIDDDGNEVIEEEKEKFDYGIEGAITNNNVFNTYKFQSFEEYENFLFIEYPIEIYGHAGLSYPTAVSDLNKLVYDNLLEYNITLVGVGEHGKAKPSTLFFLSKNGCMVNNIKFINEEDIKDAWKKCDVWITDSQMIANAMPKGKKIIKFKTNFNELFTNQIEIDKLDNIKEILQNG